MAGENVTSFFELVADASVFEGAFSKAQAKATEFAGVFKATSASVEADANRMGIAIERGIATGSMSRGSANALINDRLKFYGMGGGGNFADSVGGAGASSLGLVGLQAAAFGLLALVAAGTSAVVMTQHLVEQQAAFSQQILLSSRALNMNTADLQTWEKIASVVGIDQQSMVLDFERFAKNLNDGAPALKATGVTMDQLGITTTDAGQAVLQLADYFHTHTDQAQKAAIATALFGRSGAELIPILDQGSAAVAAYKSQLESMGVILSNSQLIQGAQAQAAITEFSTAVDVAKSQLVGAALPGFTVFFQTMAANMQNSASLWVQIGQTIGNVVMFISGLVAGFSGISLADVLAAPSNAAAAYQGLGSGAQGAAAGQDAAAGSTKAATDAITDQINALQDAKRAYDDAAEAQKASLQSQLDTLHDVTDSRRRQGEDIVTYERRLEELKLNDQIKGIDSAKTVYDRTADDQIAALQRQQQAVKEASGAMAADLSSGMSVGMLGLNDALSKGMSKAQLSLLGTAHQMGADLKAIFEDPNGDKAKAAKDLGLKLGEAFASNVVTGIAESAQNSSIPGLGAIADATLAAQWLFSHLPGHAAGYFGSTEHLARISEGGSPEVVLPLNNRSRSLSLMEQSGMADLARSAGGGGGQGGGISIQIGTVIANDPTEIARMGRALKDEARRRGLALSAGFG
jgi:hypothetical protein